MSQFKFDISTNGMDVSSYRLTCTLCAASIVFDRHLHKQAYIDKHMEVCSPPKTATQERCYFESMIRGPGGFYGVQCILAAGHPEGPEFDFFTDHKGHIWPKFGGK